MLLSIKGEEDKYFTGNPQFTFFKSVYRRHTNFALDNAYIPFVGDTRNIYGRMISITIPKSGDLLHRMYLIFNISSPQPITQLNPLGYSLFEHVEVFIQDQSIDKHYSTWLRIWHELMTDINKTFILGEMVSTQTNILNPITGQYTSSITIPLRFWFNNESGLALPLIALNMCDVRMEIKINSREAINYMSLINSNGKRVLVNQNVSLDNVQMLAEYIHLDQEERRLFSTLKHEYLITQVQTSLTNSINTISQMKIRPEEYNRYSHRIDLRFNFPVKELFWTIQDSNNEIIDNDGEKNNYLATGIFQYNYWRGFKPNYQQMIGANLVLNGRDLTDELPSTFYRNIQQYQYHSSNSIINIKDYYNDVYQVPELYRDYGQGSGVYSYSFSLDPENQIQPAGTLNFSKLENSQIKFRLYADADTADNIAYNKTMTIYAVNYNVLRIMSGFGGLAFEN